MSGSNAGTGWPLIFACTMCRRRWSRDDRSSGLHVIRTGRTRPYNGGNRGARGLDTFHEYHCPACSHTGWSRHVDMHRKPLAHYVEIFETATGKVDRRMGPMTEAKADKVERGVLMRIDAERFWVRTGTDEALRKEAAAR